MVKLSLRQGVLLTWFSGLIIKVTNSAGLQALILKWVPSGQERPTGSLTRLSQTLLLSTETRFYPCAVTGRASGAREASLGGLVLFSRKFLSPEIFL